MGEVGNNGSDNVDYATLIARRDDTGNGYYRGLSGETSWPDRPCGQGTLCQMETS